MGDRTTHGTLSPERTPFQNGINGKSHLWKVLRERRISHTYPMRLWGHSLRFRHLGHYFMEPGDYQDAPISKILHFIRSVGLLEGWNRGGRTIDLGKVAVHGPSGAYPLFIHSFIVVASRVSWLLAVPVSYESAGRGDSEPRRVSWWPVRASWVCRRSWALKRLSRSCESQL
jgi:hypothetical protein